jgi:hypothetical protein
MNNEGEDRLKRRLIAVANEHGVDAEVRDDGEVIVFCDCTVPDGAGRRLACEINVVKTMPELMALLGY